MRRILLFSLMLFLWQIQGLPQELNKNENGYSTRPFKRLDCALVVGSTGIGFDLATPLARNLRLRAGVDFMLTLDHDMYFGIQVGDDPEVSYTKFEKMQQFMKDLTGYDVNNYAIMVGNPNFDNVKLLLDVFPLRNKHWRFTAGLYYGPSEVANALNSMADMHTLMGMDIYNNIYDKLEKKEQLFKDYDIDPEMRKELWSKMKGYGRMGINMGQFSHDIEVVNKKGETVSYKAGDIYYMEPDVNGTLWAKAKANSLKPYFGAGYEGQLIPGNDRFHISCECGAMLWGGRPDVTTHDGVNLNDDIRNVRGDVKYYLDFINCLYVFPVLNLRVSINLF